MPSHRSLLPGPASPTLSEMFAGNGRDAGATEFAAGAITPGASILWVQDRMSILQAGRLFPPALPRCDLIHVGARDCKTALWAMEEGLRCPALGAVIGEIWGNPRALDFTATRRLAVASERNGVPALLILFESDPNLSAARFRWRVMSAASLPHPYDPRAPGAATLELELFKARGAVPGRWRVAHEADGFGLLSRLGDGKLAPAPAQGSEERRAA